MRQTKAAFVTDTALHLALREVHALLRRPVFWAVIGLLSLVLGLSGPFGTYDSQSTLPRLGYWAVIVVLTSLVGWLVATWVVLAFELKGWPFWAEALAAGGAVGVAVSLAVQGVNAALLDLPFLSVEALSRQAPATLVIALAVTAALLWTNRRAARPWAPPSAAPVPGTPPAQRLLARLPLDKRGALVSLSVQDHYTEITTTAGRALILLRLSDAIAEAEGVPGLQIHRSHWVALSAVARVRRDGARAVVTLKDGREVPVSRTYLPDVKGAGLL